MSPRNPGWKTTTPYSHTQFDDRSDEESCAPGRHHYVPEDDEERVWVCTRCGDVSSEDDPS